MACFFRFESITFRRTKESASVHNDMEQKTGLVEALIVEIKDRDRIGAGHLNSDDLCCTLELSKEGHCNQWEVFIRPNKDSPKWPNRIQTFFQGAAEEANMGTQTVYVEKTGMYYLYFMFCDPQLKGTRISGKTVWKNPGGYLPGKMATLMIFYGFMSLAYLALGLIWFLQFNYITIVIALGMCEMAFWYFEYANFNSTGIRPVGITVWAVTFTAVKKTVSRLLLLVVSMGYGVVRPTLGGITSKGALLGVIYFVASEVLELFENVGNINDFSGKVKLFLVLPVAVLDACFILWIFSSLSKTLEKLQMRRSMAKLELYRKFTNCLAISLYFNSTDPLTFWTMLAYLLLAVICMLWAPSQSSTRYAYSDEAADDFDEEEGVALTGLGAVKATERKAMTSNHVFGLSEDLEEDKRG
ncbi:hypothetical protein AMTRI_Chr08g168250 [Amborella trichopoda]